MKIRNTKFEVTNGRAVLSADITIDSKTESVFFSVDEKYKDLVARDSSPFVITMLLASMKKGDPIEAEGFMSEKLMRSLGGVYKLFRDWGTYFYPTQVACEVRPDVMPGHLDVGCFFSGGVDSFHTYLRNRNKPGEPIKYLVLVHGFDIDIRDDDLFRTTHSNLSEIALREGVELVVVKTNLRRTTERYVPWIWSSGSATGAVALFLRAGLRKIYIASSNSWDELFPFGTHPDLDPLWSTETLEINHDSNDFDRLQKVKYIADNDSVRSYLRVCYDNYAGRYNCGRCEKCIRTMLEFKVWDKLDAVKTFSGDIDPRLLENLENTPTTQRHFGKCLKELERQGKFPDVQSAIRRILSGKNKMSYYMRFRRAVVYFDRQYFGSWVAVQAYRLRKKVGRSPYWRQVLAKIG